MTKAEIQLVRALADKRGRTEHGLFVAEGEKLIGELRGSHLKVRKIFALEGVFAGPEVETVAPRDMERLSLLKTAANSLAIVETPRYGLDMRSLAGRLTLALDDVQNPGNLGTIVRLADWFGIADIVCSEASADCFNPKVVQATMGAILRVRVHYTDLGAFLHDAGAAGLPVYGTFLEGENIYGTTLTEEGGRGARRDAQALHPALPDRPPRVGVAQRGDGHGHRMLGIPASGRHGKWEIGRRTTNKRLPGLLPAVIFCDIRQGPRRGNQLRHAAREAAAQGRFGKGRLNAKQIQHKAGRHKAD